MEDQSAQAALVANLRHLDYMHVIFGTLGARHKPSSAWISKESPV